MPLLSRRSQNIMPSPIRKFLPLVERAEARGLEVIKLNVGDPDISPPAGLLRAIKNYRLPTIKYAPSPGIKEHVAAWIKFYAEQRIKLKPENIIPTLGCAEAILLSMIAVADPGDEIIIFEPVYASYKGFALMAGVKLVPVTLSVNNNFVLPAASVIEKKITAKTKAIVIINPNNPTGTVLSKKELAKIIALAAKHDIFIIADETYREIIFSGQPISVLHFTKARDRAIMLDSASKRFSAPGARIGCLVSYNKKIMGAVLKLAMARLSAPTLEQYGLIPILNNAQPYLRKIIKEYKNRRDVAAAALRKMPGVKFYIPQGALYITIALPLADAEDFVIFLLTKFSYRGKTVIVAPAAGFYLTPGLGKNEVRLAYVMNTTKLKEAMLILKKGLAEYLKQKSNNKLRELGKAKIEIKI